MSETLAFYLGLALSPHTHDVVNPTAPRRRTRFVQRSFVLTASPQLLNVVPSQELVVALGSTLDLCEREEFVHSCAQNLEVLPVILGPPSQSALKKVCVGHVLACR
jgi:hypothetical protein